MERVWVWGPSSWEIDWQRSKLTSEQLRAKLQTALAHGAANEIEVILLSSNDLTSLPFELLSQFKKLTNLSANDNKLTSVAGLGLLPLLKIVQLGANALSEFPADVLKLEALETLELYHNKISDVPPEISRLQNLRSLNLGNNALAQLAPEVGGLKLYSLYVQNNHLKALPRELRNLGRLENVSLAGNPLPKELAKTIEGDKRGVQDLLALLA